MPHRNTEPADPYQTRNDTICHLASVRVIGKFQAQASLDDGERQDHAAPPNVESRPNGSPVCPDVDGVVKDTESGLKEEGGDDGETDDWVVFAELYEADQPAPSLLSNARSKVNITNDFLPNFVGA